MKHMLKSYLIFFTGIFIFFFACSIAFMQINFPGKVPILVYHCVGDNPAAPDGDALFVTKENFEKQMIFLKNMGYTTIFAKDLNNPLPRRPIVLTFDDGYENNYTEAFPILQKYKMKATIFVVGGMIEEPGKLKRLSWDQMKEMEQSGIIDIQSHTFMLHGIDSSGQYASMKKPEESASEYKARILADLNCQREAFIKHLGHEPVAIAFPNGYHNEELEQIYHKENDMLCFTITPMIAKPAEQHGILPRIPVFYWTELPVTLFEKTIKIND